MKEGYSCNYEKSRMEEWLNKNFINKEYIVFKEDLEKLEEYGEKKSITLGNLITIALSEVFYRWSDGSGLKLIVSDDLRDSSILNLDYKKGTSIDYNFKGNERLNELCSKFEEESKRAFKYERKYISEIFSNMICEKDEENKKVIIISTNLFKEPKEKIENCNDNDYYCHERELYGVYINEDHIPDAIIQCYIEKSSGDLKIIWYLNNEFYTNEMCNDMERAHKEFINWIGKGYWDEIVPDLMPQSQKEIRKRINSTKVSVKKQLLHQQFFLNAEKYEKNQAILWDENGDTKSMTYGELANKALKLGALLMKQGVKQGDVVAITQPRGVNQIISVLGILAVGAAYVPVGIKQPKERRDRIYKIGGIKHVVMCEEELEKESLEESIEVILIKDLENIEPIAKPINMETDSLAYVIFTSGSTGEPKGVEITHEAAYNTIIDINTRFSIDSNDKALNISSFDFDLSVYDVFGMLSVGGGIVLLKEGEEREASIWSELVNRTKVTVWNSVPALFDMFLTGSGNNMLNSLKLVLVSGDWVGLDLQERLLKKSKHCRFIALGGATEASIWSNYYEVKEVHKSWTSIPYGTPLTNQCFRVINKLGKDCPDMVPGELWIGGMGVARGYIGDKELTSRSFVIKDSERWYRTGDLGRYWKDGIIEFLGRADHQVKLRGFRIELGEIEAALKQYKGVGQGVASVISSGDSKHLVAAVVMDNMKGQIAPSLEFNEHIESYRSNIREKQSEIVEALIIEILGLNNLNRDSIKERNFIEEFKIDREYKQLLKMWLLWLNERKVIDYRHGVIYEGLRFHKAITYINSLKEGSEWDNEEFILAIGKTILKKLEDYRAILRGEKSSFILLDDNNLSPENLASKDSGTLEGIKVISDRIKVISRKNHRPVKVALIGGRNGVMAEILLKLLHPSQIELTLLDSASSMLRGAEEKLSRYEHSIGYEVLKDNCVAENLRYSFDVAVAINSLHRYHNSYEGVALASLLLKNGGKIFALEHCELAPIALVTAAILEKGFKDLDHERKERFTSMLNSHEWSNLFSKYGFTAIEYSSIKESFTELIEGICPLERPILQIEEITNFITKLLPQHMIPEKIEVLSSLPLTSNGKVNRKELERVFHFTTENKSIEEAHEGMEKYVEQLWIKLIGVSRVSRDEGFFEIGGDSLLATRFIAQIKESVGVDISLKNIFEKPLLHQVAEYIESNLEDLEQSACSMEEGEI